MLDLGTLRVGIDVASEQAKSKLKGFKEEVEKTEKSNEKSTHRIKAAWSKVGGVIKTAMKATVAGIAAATASIAALTKKSLENSASYEQLSGGVEKLFGNSADTIRKYAAEAYKTAGLTANQYMDTVTSFSAGLISSLGGDTKRAAKIANMAVKDMSDNANTFGTDMQSIMNAYQGFAKQNYTMLDNLKLGYGGTKTEMERLIADANKLRKAQGKTAKLTINNLSDVYKAIHTIQKDFKITGTTIKEASKTIEGSINMSKAAFDNWLTSLGSADMDTKTATDNMVNAFAGMASNVLPKIGEIATSLIETIPEALEGIEPAFESAFEGIDVDGIMVGILETLTDTIKEANPSEAIGQFVQQLTDAVTGEESTSEVASAGAELAEVLVTEIGEFLGDPANWGNIATIIGTMLTRLVDSAWNEWLGGATGVYMNDGNIQTTPPAGHADGGVFTKPTLLGNGRHLVGEAGTEAVIPLSQDVLASIGAGAAMAYAGGSTTTTTVNNYYVNNAVVNQDKDIEDKFTSLMNDIRRKGGM